MDYHYILDVFNVFLDKESQKKKNELIMPIFYKSEVFIFNQKFQ